MAEEKNNKVTIEEEDEDKKTLKEFIKEHHVSFIIFTSIFSVCLVVVLVCLIIALSNGPTSDSPSWQPISEMIRHLL